jgi:HSP20 family protein
MFSLIPRRHEEKSTLSSASRTPFEMMRREFGTLLDRFFGGWPSDLGISEGWGLDMEDAGSEVVIRAEAPGFQPSEFDVQLSGDMLTIRAEHREEGDGQAGHRHWSRLERTVTLPSGMDPNKVDARYINGVLELHLPKTPEAQPRRIEVKA